MHNSELSILIVDDMRFSRAVLKNSLKEAGYTDIRTTDSGAHALELVRERKADVVLCNWTMPEMSGIELAIHLRDLDEMKQRYTGIVLFTAREGNATLIEAFQKGVDDYIRIPVDTQELAGRVFAAGRLAQLQNTLLRRSQALDDLQDQELTNLNFIDNKTGIANQRYLTLRLNNLIKTIEENRGGLSLVFIQIPLEVYNVNEDDAYSVLEQIAKSLKGSLRKDDIIAYYGNNTFSIILYRANPQPYPKEVLQRILKQLKDKEIKYNNEILSIEGYTSVCHYQPKIGSNISPEKLIDLTSQNLEKAFNEEDYVYMTAIEE